MLAIVRVSSISTPPVVGRSDAGWNAVRIYAKNAMGIYSEVDNVRTNLGLTALSGDAKWLFTCSGVGLEIYKFVSGVP